MVDFSSYLKTNLASEVINKSRTSRISFESNSHLFVTFCCSTTEKSKIHYSNVDAVLYNEKLCTSAFFNGTKPHCMYCIYVYHTYVYWHSEKCLKIVYIGPRLQHSLSKFRKWRWKITFSVTQVKEWRCAKNKHDTIYRNISQ